MKSKFKLLTTSILLSAVIFFGFQNCTQSKVLFSQSPLSLLAQSPRSQDSGNGGTYDGKPLVFHEVVEDFRCQGRPQPRSILMRKNATEWFITRNTRTKCADVDHVAVTGVVYNPVQNTAVFEGKTYIPPLPYLVDASEDSNLTDANLLDGVCEDRNGKCSLRAAIDQASFVTFTASVRIQVQKGNYLLSAPLQLSINDPLHTITVHGEDATTTILDGQGITDIAELGLVTSGGAAIFDNLTFLNGNNTVMKHGSGITTGTFTLLTVTNSFFKGCAGNPAIFVGLAAQSLTLQNTVLSGNSDTAVNVEGGSAVLIEDSSISNGGNGYINQLSSKVTIRRSSFFNNTGLGISTLWCYDSSLENVTIFNNAGTGLQIGSFSTGDPTMNFTVTNSTIVNNGGASGNNLVLYYRDPLNHLIFNNSILAVNSSAKANCGWVNGESHTIIATGSLFDDSSCSQNGSYSIGNPLLGPLGSYGGLTPTLMPMGGSPAIDAGVNSVCAVSDQRSLPRPVDKLGGGPRCDIGAVEVQ